MTEGLGFLAGALTTIAFLPQVVRTWKSRSVEDLSLGMLLIFNLGIVMWIVYGAAIHSWPVIVSNAVTLLLTALLLTLKLRYR